MPIGQLRLHHNEDHGSIAVGLTREVVSYGTKCKETI